MNQNHVLLTSLRVRIPLRVLCRDATTAAWPVLKAGDPRKRTGGSSLSHGAYQYRQICKLAKQAVCKTVAFGRCRFKSYSADLYAAVPQLVEELSGRQTAG